MPLDFSKLQKVKQRNGKTIAQCPACAESGGDGDGTHLAVFDDGHFACIKYQGDAEHRKRIFALAGLPPDHAPAMAPAPVPVRREPQAEALDWQACCAALLRNTTAQERLATWRGWTPDFVRTCAQAGALGLHDGMVSFPVAPDGVTITGAHCFGWPNTSASKAWYANGKNWPLIIGAASLAGAREVHIMEGQWDAMSLLHAKNWTGGPLDKPFIVTRGTSVNAALMERLAEVETVNIWPQNDTAKQDRKPTPSEEWTVRVLALLPPNVTTIRRVDTPEPFKDWNDVLRARGAAETLAAIKTAVRAALNVEPPAAVPPVTLSALSAESPAPLNNADNADFGTGDSTGNDSSPDEPFPLDALPAAMREITAEAARVSLTPISLTASCVLATVSAAMGGGLEVDSGGVRRARGNLYLLVIAESGTGKGAGFKAVSQPFLNAELDALFDWRERTLIRAKTEIMVAEAQMKRLKEGLGKPKTEERESLLDELAEANRELEAAKLRAVEPTWITADSTREALEKMLAESPCETIASLSPEARGVVDVICGRYNKGQSDESIYLSAYSGETCKVHRKNSQPVTLKRPCLTVLWMLQPDKMRDMLANPALTESGMMPRFLICNTKAEPQNEPETWPAMDVTVAATWNALIRELASAFRSAGANPHCITYPPEVRAMFRDYFNRIVPDRRTGGALADVSSYAARWAENGWRLAVVLHAAEHGVSAPDVELTTETATNALRIMEWFTRQQLSLLAAGRHERQRTRMDNLKTALETYPDRICTLRDLERRHGIERAEVESLVRIFPALVVIEKVKTGKAGQPSVMVRLVNTEAKR